MLYDIMLGKDNDIIRDNGDFETTKTDFERLRQQISISLKTWMGEWFLNTTFGIPYRQKLLQKGITKSEVDAEFIRVINSFDEVREITYFKSEIDRVNRSYGMSFHVSTLFGTMRFSVLVGERVQSPLNDIINGEPCIYGTMDKESISSMYELINITLPTNF
jgi:hypothetical protein